MLFTRFVLRAMTLTLGVLGMALPLSAAQSVEVHLRGGQVVVGEMVRDEPDQVMIKLTSLAKNGKTMSMTMPYKRDDIVKIVKLADPAELYPSKSAQAKSAAEHLALAMWCRENSLNDQAIVHAKKAVELDPAQEVAVKMLSDLDLALIDGKWVKESEALAAQGKVRYQGKVMTIAEADAMKATAQKQAAISQAQKAADDKENSIATIDKQIAELQQRSTELDATLEKANNDLNVAQNLTQKVSTAKATLDAAINSLDQARATNQQRQTNNDFNNQIDLQPLAQAVENAQKALNAARRESGSAEARVAQAKAKINSLTSNKATLEKNLAGLNTRREIAVKALEQAKAAEEAAKAAAEKAAAGKPAQ
jgi:predicted  nucleic acid-binding Zn-ribbon protein